MFNIKISGLVAVACLAIAGCSPADAPDPSATAPDSSAAAPAAKAQASSNSVLAKDHFHPKGKEPSEHTKRILREARSGLPLSDKRDFEEYAKGFIAAPDSKIIMADAGHAAWDLERYNFLLEQDEFDSIHPSLVRQSQLNMNFGLYEVIPGIYQVRGFDLANITFVKGNTGWIVFDPVTASETARAAKELLDEHLGELPIVAVVYSHNHGDHWAGVRGLVSEEDVSSGKVQIIAPRNFMHHAISEQVFAGNAMNRRMFFQYGVLLPANPYGHVGQGLSQGTAAGHTGLIPPSRTIEKDVEELTVDGVRMEFQNTPNTEAPAEMNTWFPDMKALWTAENVTGVFHNIYTLRGTPVRDALAWSKFINLALYEYGQEAEVMFASHHWPRWGNERIQEVLKGQRDLYANINNQVLHHANNGVTINQIHNVFETPKSISNQWYNRGYHGSPEHNSRGVIQRYLGFWDVNPATLIPLSPADSAPLYVEMMGGAGPIMAKGRELRDTGRYLEASEILNKLVHAEPQNQEAKDLLADVYEQLGYQQENPGLRNSFLAGAYELRTGIPEGATPDSMTADIARAMTTNLFLDFLGILMDAHKADGMAFTINLVTPDNGEQFVIELSNNTLTNIEGYQAEDADLTLTITRLGMAQAMIGAKPLMEQIESGDAKAEGDAGVLKQLASTIVRFDPRFEILPGTAGAPEDMDLNDFEVGPVQIHGE
jgi:alkyl sulfatase BDS1-like metallo-beta-lactamase superfamily hydrolase